MTLTLDQMATPHFQVVCRCHGGVFYLVRNLSWSHESTNLEPLVFTSRADARRALNRAYKHRDDKHEVIQISGFGHRSYHHN